MVIQVNFRFLIQFLSLPLFFTKNKKIYCANVCILRNRLQRYRPKTIVKVFRKSNIFETPKENVY